MPNPIWTFSASLEVRKVSIYGINSKRNCKKKEKWTQLRMPNRTECRYFFSLSPRVHCRNKTSHSGRAQPWLPFHFTKSTPPTSIQQRGALCWQTPQKQSEPKEEGHCAQRSDWLGSRGLQASAYTQLAPGVGTLWVLSQTAHAGLCPLDASRH